MFGKKIMLASVIIMSSSVAFAAETPEDMQMYQNNASNFMQGVQDLTSSTLKGFGALSQDSDMCKKLEKNYYSVMQNEFFMDTGNQIKDAWKNGNTDAPAVMSYWTKLLESPQPNKFDKAWEKFWSKDMRSITFFQKNYKCNRFGDEMRTALNETQKFMYDLGYTEWSEKFEKMYMSMPD